ncbi:MAG TPA: putative cytokinetic ring protein SteA [Nocardioidaceae bacterium]|nr:putative cytokinetic ring protein SteA [Nocardioidaceae bacterium]
MRFPSRQRPVHAPPGVTGTVRLDRRTKLLVRRLRPGEIAVVDHLDMDRATAEALLDHGVAAVVNAAPFISGRYANLGPELLARSGVLLLDNVGAEVFGAVRDGATVRIDGDALLAGDRTIATGRPLGVDEVAALMEQSRAGLATQLQSLAHNTTEFLRREQELLLHGQGVPELRTRLEGRPVVVVARAYDYREDLRRLRRFIREQRPVLVGVDAGADALSAAGHRPDIVVVGEAGLALSKSSAGGGQGVSDKTLRAAREVVLHTDRTGRAVGSDRLDRLGVRAHQLPASGETGDVALLIADSAGASLIISAGAHRTLDEFLDRQHAGLASTFLTQLRVGPRLVDAKGVPELYAGRVRTWQLLLVLLVGLVAVAVAVASTPVGQQWWESIAAWIQGLFT